MYKENHFTIGGMNIEIYLPSEEVLGKAIIIPKLPHGSNIVEITSGDETIEDCDALITDCRGISVGIRTADCAPVCFSDGETIGIAHVGWRGLCLGLTEKMLAHFDTENLSVYIAPFLHTFEIQKDSCYDQIVEKFGERYIERQPDKLVFHFKDAIDSLLPPETKYDSRDTASDLDLPSHRHDKTTERLTTVVSFL